jgi:hypothetical protein
MPMGTCTHQTRGGGSLFQRLSESFEAEKDNNDTRLDDRRKFMTRHCASGYVSINRQKGADRVRMRNNGFAIGKKDEIGMGRPRFNV